MIPYGRQDISKEDINAVVKVLKSDYLTQGPVTPLFEEEVKNYCSAKFSFAFNSATSALHAACFSLGLSKGDHVWTSANTFVASANCALYCDAKIDFIDIDPDTYNLCINSLKKKLVKAKKDGKLPKVVIPVHLAGQSCKMKEIYSLSKKYKFKIIEDASHAIGGKYLSEKIGGCKYSDITVFSFHPVKIITTGEGGIATTNDKKIAEKLDMFRTHGITKNEKKLINISHGSWFYEQQYLGFNYRMTDIHAAIGLSQMKRLDKMILKRHEIASIYNSELKDLPVKIPYQDPDSFSSFHLYILRLDLGNIKMSQKDIFSFLRDEKIFVNLHYIPVYFHPYYENLGFKKGHCVQAEKYYREAISIPIYPTLLKKDQKKVIKTLKKILK